MLARRSGDRLRESIAVANLCVSNVLTGRWDEVEELAEHALGDLQERPGSEFIHAPLAIVHALRGRRDAARATLAHLDGWGEGDDEELRAMHGAVAVVVALAADEPEQALALGEQMARSALATLTATDDAFRIGWPDSVEAALRLGDKQAARSLLSLVEEGLAEAARPPYLAAQLERLQALVDATGDAGDELSVAGGLQGPPRMPSGRCRIRTGPPCASSSWAAGCSLAARWSGESRSWPAPPRRSGSSGRRPRWRG